MGDAATEQEQLEQTTTATDEQLQEQPSAEGEGHDDVVLEGEQTAEEESPAPQKRNPIRSMRKRIKEQNRELRESRGANESLREEIARLNQTIRNASQPQQPAAEAVPTQRPTLQSAGYDTDRYEQQLDQWYQEQMGQMIEDRLGQQSQDATQQRQSAAFDQAISGHYERANALNVPDYEVIEDAAARMMGLELVEAIQATSEKSEQLIYFLGKRPEKATEIRTLYEQNPGKATLALGELSSQLTLKPKTKTPPDPEVPVRGGGGAQGSPAFNKHYKDLQKAYDAGDLTEIRRVRQQAKAEGIELPFNITE